MACKWLTWLGKEGPLFCFTLPLMKFCSFWDREAFSGKERLGGKFWQVLTISDKCWQSLTFLEDCQAIFLFDHALFIGPHLRPIIRQSSAFCHPRFQNFPRFRVADFLQTPFSCEKREDLRSAFSAFSPGVARSAECGKFDQPALSWPGLGARVWAPSQYKRGLTMQRWRMMTNALASWQWRVILQCQALYIQSVVLVNT